MARNSTPIQVIVHYPKSEADRLELAKKTAGAHADMVNQYIRKLNCPSIQKTQLLDEIINFTHTKNSSCKNRNCLN